MLKNSKKIQKAKKELDTVIKAQIEKDGYEVVKDTYIKSCIKTDKVYLSLAIALGILATILFGSYICAIILILIIPYMLTSLERRKQLHGSVFDERYGKYKS